MDKADEDGERSAGPPPASSALGGQESEAPSFPAGAAETASPGRRRSAPSGGSEVHKVTNVGAVSIWRVPDLSLRWWPVFMRNLLVWRKLAGIPKPMGFLYSSINCVMPRSTLLQT